MSRVMSLYNVQVWELGRLTFKFQVAAFDRDEATRVAKDHVREREDVKRSNRFPYLEFRAKAIVKDGLTSAVLVR